MGTHSVFFDALWPITFLKMALRAIELISDYFLASVLLMLLLVSQVCLSLSLS